MLDASTDYGVLQSGPTPTAAPGNGFSDDAYLGRLLNSENPHLLIIVVVLSIVPIALCCFPMNGLMVLGGFNSLVISAACHCIPTAEENQGPKASPLSSAVEDGLQTPTECQYKGRDEQLPSTDLV
jgi:hypothetical protein